MVLLQNKLNLKVSQRQILTPGLVQMVSILALNKLELKDMITEEMVENPVLDELESQVPTIDEIAGKEEERSRDDSADEKTDPFDEIDFGSFFQDYLDPGHRTYAELESIERPSFENFLSRPTTLTDHLEWQLGALSLSPKLREAAEMIIGNLNEDGYLNASEEELLVSSQAPEAPALPVSPEVPGVNADSAAAGSTVDGIHLVTPEEILRLPRISLEIFQEALKVVQTLDPIGVAARDLRECLLVQLHHQQELLARNGDANGAEQAIADGIAVVDTHLLELQNKQYKEIGKAIGRPLDAVMAAFNYIRTLDPKPGARYNQTDPRLIEPDVAFVKQGDEWLVLMNDDDLPQLRLNPTYKRLLNKNAAEKDVRNYVKERYKSAIQLIKNIEQRKQTILKVCYSIIERQHEFLDHGIDHLKPMMIKEVAEEIGVHPSTVSRAVSNKYVHTPQGVYELRYFFTESVQGPEGGGTSLLILKRRVKKLIEDEDPKRPLTDDQITHILQSQGIQVTRRTVAKYREDMNIPSTHQRRVKG